MRMHAAGGAAAFFLNFQYKNVTVIQGGRTAGKKLDLLEKRCHSPGLARSPKPMENKKFTNFFEFFSRACPWSLMYVVCTADAGGGGASEFLLEIRFSLETQLCEGAERKGR
jgi:hypothetical protein